MPTILRYPGLDISRSGRTKITRLKRDRDIKPRTRDWNGWFSDANAKRENALALNEQSAFAERTGYVIYIPGSSSFTETMDGEGESDFIKKN